MNLRMTGRVLSIRLLTSACNMLDIARATKCSTRGVQQVLAKDLPVPPGWSNGLKELDLISSQEQAELSRACPKYDSVWLRNERLRLNLTSAQVATLVHRVDPLLCVVKTTITCIEQSRLSVPDKWVPILRAAGFRDPADPADPAGDQQPGLDLCLNLNEEVPTEPGESSGPSRDYDLVDGIRVRFAGAFALLYRSRECIALLRFDGSRWVVLLQRPPGDHLDPILAAAISTAFSVWRGTTTTK